MFVWKKTHDAEVELLKLIIEGRTNQRDDEARRANMLAAELATLRPDAEKWRAKCAKGSLNLKQNQKREVVSVDGYDSYDTTRDSRRDDRDIHGL